MVFDGKIRLCKVMQWIISNLLIVNLTSAQAVGPRIVLYEPIFKVTVRKQWTHRNGRSTILDFEQVFWPMFYVLDLSKNYGDVITFSGCVVTLPSDESSVFV